MCGIAGIFERTGGRPDEGLLQRMHARIRHRGPDDDGILVDGPVGLAHRRLSILDLTAAGHQPMVSEDGTAALAYNGEIYNYRRLRSELETEGCRFRSDGDTEVLLQACRRWGPATAARKADGMFAFAYWDQAGQTLWLARDRTGIKPLYYHLSSDRVFFASELRALLEAVPARVNEPALLGLLMTTPLQDPETPFAGIRAVLGGEIVSLGVQSGWRSESFYSLTEAVDPELYRELDALPDDALVRRFSELLRQSVSMHLASDARLAVMASGGLDSSIVTRLAAVEMTGVPAYHAEVQGAHSELHWARQLCDSAQLPLHVASVGREDYLKAIAHASYSNECPISLHPNTVPFYLVCKKAADDGVKVLLTGEGADELLGGYPVFRGNQIRRQFEARLDRLGGVLRAAGLEKVARNLRWLLDSDAHYGHRSRASGLLTRGRVLRPYVEGDAAYGFIDDPLERSAQVDLFAYMHGYLQSILWRNDRMGMAVSLESRVPFLENELIRFSLSLPLRFKVRGRINKWVLRRAAAGLLPPALVNRPKFGFPVDAADYVFAGDDFLRGGFLGQALDLDAPSVDALTHEYPALRFPLLLVELWGRVFFLGESENSLTERLLAASLGRC